MRSRARKLQLAVILVVMLTLAGCPQGDRWQQAADASDKLIMSVQSAQQIEISAYQSHLVTIDEHIKVEQAFKKIAQADKTLNVAIRAGSSAKDASAAFGVAVEVTDEAINTGLITVKNPTVSLALNGSIATTRALLDSIKQIATGK